MSGCIIRLIMCAFALVLTGGPELALYNAEQKAADEEKRKIYGKLRTVWELGCVAGFFVVIFLAAKS